MPNDKKIPIKVFLSPENSDIKKENIPFKINQNSEKLFQKISQNEIDKKRKLKKEIKDCVKEWCLDTTSHGFSNMVRADNWITRLVWLFLVITLTAYCFFSIYAYFVQYINYDVVTGIEVINESPTDFPSFTFCNINPFDINTDNETGTYINSKLIENKISPTISINSTTYLAKALVEQAASILKASVTGDSNLDEASLKKKGFSIDTMLISCYYNNQQCNASDFTWSRSNEYGNCYTFNGLLTEDSKKSSKTGPKYGLNLELFIGSSDNNYYLSKSGVHAFVHDRGVLPLYTNEGIDLMPGYASSITVSRTKYSKSEPPYSSCRKDTSTISSKDTNIYIETLKISKYSQKICYEICVQNLYIIPNCNCSDPNVPTSNKQQKICTSFYDLECVSSQRGVFDSLKIEDICDAHCPLECDTTVYSTSVTSAQYPTNYYWEIIKYQSNILSMATTKNTFKPGSLNQPVLSQSAPDNNENTSMNNNSATNTNITTTTTSPNQNNQNAGEKPLFAGDEMKTSILAVSVYYDNLKYSLIEEVPAIDFITLIGVIGGQFGLFMGASFLSFVEIAEMLINLVRVTIKNAFDKKKVVDLKA